MGHGGIMPRDESLCKTYFRYFKTFPGSQKRAPVRGIGALPERNAPYSLLVNLEFAKQGVKVFCFFFSKKKTFRLLIRGS